MFIIIGTNHKYSPIEIREKLSFTKKRIKETLLFLKERNGLQGAIIISTCNRVEIYASVKDSTIGLKELEDFIYRYYEIGEDLSAYMYKYIGKEALKHLILVACGFDSLILGETQVLSQLEASFLKSQEAGFIDKFLTESFCATISLAREIHQKNLISKGEISVGSLAVEFIKARLGTLNGKKILIIGTGKVTDLVLNSLKEESPEVVFVSNRTFERAEQLAHKIAAEAIRFDNLEKALESVDAIIAATSSPHFILKKNDIIKAIGHRPLLIIDLSVPRNVDPGIGKIERVELFNLEDLGKITQENLKRRNVEAKKATEIIDLRLGELWERLTAREHAPALLH